MKLKKSKPGLMIGTLGASVLLAALGVSTAQAGRDVTSNPEQTAFYEPDDSKPTISPDEASAERVKNFPALQPYDVSQPLVPVSDLLPSARAVSTDGARESPVFAAALSYGELKKFSPGLGADVQIAEDRPVWVVTVHGPIENSGTLYGTKSTVWDVYTVVYDGPSGDGIAYGTGEDAEKLGITGEYIE